jgi:thiol-disulfide isomerase/thioredoxin
MLRPILWSLVLLLPVPAAGAQDTKDQSKKEKPTPAEQFKAMQKEFAKAREKLENAYAEADTAAERKALVAKFYQQQKEFVRRHLELAKQFPRDPVALDALVFVLTHGRSGPEVQKAADLLVRNHAQDKRAGEFCPTLAQSVNGEKVLRALAEKNPRRAVRGLAGLFLARHLTGMASMVQTLQLPEEMADKEMAESLAPETIKRLKARDAGQLRKEAEKWFEQVKAKYGDIDYDDQTLKSLAGAELYFLRHLSVGSKALDIEGEDIAGKKMKLSDFRGKVVVLNFWASWCGPCMALVPHERDLVKRLEKKPFAFLGVNGDEDRDVAKKVTQKEKMTWRSWWDEGDRISQKWRVTAIPTIFVIDAKGVIRFKNVRKEALDRAVDYLLKEMEQEQKGKKTSK